MASIGDLINVETRDGNRLWGRIVAITKPASGEGQLLHWRTRSGLVRVINPATTNLAHKVYPVGSRFP